MFFDLSNYLLFILLISAAYSIFSIYLQSRIGGKDRLKNLQAEMKEVQKTMIDAGKRKDEKAVNEAMSQNWKLSMELMSIQMKMMVVVFGALFGLMLIFPYLEPGMEDDITVPLFDDGLATHCDYAASDNIYSGCLEIPQGSQAGGWAVDVFLKDKGNATLSRNATAIYVEGGEPWHLWVQNMSSQSFIDSLAGKKITALNITSDRMDYTRGGIARLEAFAASPLQEGERLDAVADAGTFFHVDLPFTIPLFNLRRIIGSYGVFLFSVFVLSMLFSIAKSAYSKVSKK